jgi:hypothetical protein
MVSGCDFIFAISKTRNTTYKRQLSETDPDLKYVKATSNESRKMCLVQNSKIPCSLRKKKPGALARQAFWYPTTSKVKTGSLAIDATRPVSRCPRRAGGNRAFATHLYILGGRRCAIVLLGQLTIVRMSNLLFDAGIAGVPVDGAHFAIFFSELKGVNEAKDFVDGAPDRKIIDGNLSSLLIRRLWKYIARHTTHLPYYASRVDDEQAPERDALILEEDPIVAAQLVVLVAQQRNLDTAESAVGPRRIGPCE